jgi:hypothetical protein
MRSLNIWRLIAALAILAVAAGTVVAASPSPSPAESAIASPSAPLASAQASSEADPSTLAPSKASEAPDASETPDESEAPDKAETPDSPPTAAEAADFVSRLKAAGITTTPATFQALAAKVGVGGAVRTLAFAQASGKTPAQILAMVDAGKGWGQIDHELGLSIGPGIGWIMGHGHGKSGSH